MPALPSPEEIEAARTDKGAWTRATLDEWGVAWPPVKGWKDELIARWESAHQEGGSGTP
ncbi:hypothetical protein AB0D14_33765 [Streptomyces sp. NPDC048484]|uniref:hypothetical protein n=1 Tax=Streptomyces sp. NPDC048484 TaxID=3155146 RepID=UPI00341D827B